MSWLFVAQLRSFVLLAGAASLLLNLALLMPSIYMMQVFDRVFSSRSVETLVMLSVMALLALALGFCMDVVRARALAWSGRALDRRLSPAALAGVLRDAAGVAGRANTDVLRDIAQLRAFLSGTGIQAMFDAPWLPIYVLVIGLMHPLLGLAAAIGAGAAGRARRADRTVDARARRARAALLARRRPITRKRSRATPRSIIGMGMTKAAVASWETRHQAAARRAGAVSAPHRHRLSAIARMTRQALQIVMLALGAWLVVDAHASPGIMVAATILLGRALQPVEQLISGWKVPGRSARSMAATERASGRADRARRPGIAGARPAGSKWSA